MVLSYAARAGDPEAIEFIRKNLGQIEEVTGVPKSVIQERLFGSPIQMRLLDASDDQRE